MDANKKTLHDNITRVTLTSNWKKTRFDLLTLKLKN